MKNLIVKKLTVVSATLLLTGSIGMSVCAAPASAATSKNAGKTTEVSADSQEKPAANGEKPAEDAALPTDDGEKPTEDAALPTDASEIPDDSAELPQKGFIDVAATQEAIDAVTDDDLQTSLQDLLDTYTAALDAEKEGLDNSLSDDEMQALGEAVKDAGDALVAALEDAGITTDGLIKEENVDETIDEAVEPTEEAAVPDETAEKADATKTTVKATEKAANIITKAKTWLKNLFS